MRNFLAEHSEAFDPNEVHTLVAAFDKAWEAVQASGVVYPEAKAEAARAILAKHIIAAAKHGERDHARLRDGALLALAQSPGIHVKAAQEARKRTMEYNTNPQ
jgi:hypothetical protein